MPTPAKRRPTPLRDAAPVPRKRTTRSARPVAFQEPMLDAPDKTASPSKPALVKAAPSKPAARPESRPAADDAPERPVEHKGIPIEREERVGNLPSGAKFKITKLWLANGEKAFACWDCRFTADGRGDVMAHRNAEHGSQYGKKRPKVIWEAEKGQLGDLVLPPREDGSPAPSDAMQWTMAELLALVPSLTAMGTLIDDLEHKREALETELAAHRANAHKVAVYESLREEVVELRVMVRDAGAYRDLKAEVVELRNWKKKMIAKLNSLGFTLTEEEEQ